MASKNYWVRMLKTASGPKLERKALDAGREYPVSEDTIRGIEFAVLDTSKLDDATVKQAKENRAAKETAFKSGKGFRGDVFEILHEMSADDISDHKEKVEAAKAKA